MSTGKAFCRTSVCMIGIAAASLAAEAATERSPTRISTPETSKLFVRHVDPITGVESYLLKPGIFSFHQQGY